MTRAENTHTQFSLNKFACLKNGFRKYAMRNEIFMSVQEDLKGERERKECVMLE